MPVLQYRSAGPQYNLFFGQLLDLLGLLALKRSLYFALLSEPFMHPGKKRKEAFSSQCVRESLRAHVDATFLCPRSILVYDG